MSRQAPFKLHARNIQRIGAKFTEIRKSHLARLYKSGLLQLDDLRELFAILDPIPYLFNVRYDIGDILLKDVTIFQISSASRKEEGDILSNVASEGDETSPSSAPKLSSWLKLRADKLGRLAKENPREALARQKKRTAPSGFFRIEGPDCELFVGSQAQPARAVLEEICQYASLVVHNTLAWRSLQKDRLNQLSYRLLKDLTVSERFNIDSLAAFIALQMGVTIGLLEKRTKNKQSIAGADQRANGSPEKKARPKKAGTQTVFVLRRSDLGHFSEQGTEVQASLAEKAEISLRGAKLIEVNSKEIDGGSEFANSVLFPLSRSTEPHSQRNQLFLVSRPQSQIDQNDIHLIEELISYFFDQMQRVEQQGAITAIVKEINQLQRKPVGEPSDMELDYQGALDRIVRNIISTTACYRCSIWEYSAQSHSLVPGMTLAYKAGTIQKPPDAFITAAALNLFNKSSVVNCFTSALATDEPLYIGDVRKFEKYIRKRDDDGKLEEHIHARDLLQIIPPPSYTQSEISIPIFEAGTPVGVLYAESRLIDAFDAELQYFQTMGSLLSELRTAQNRRLDSSFVARRLSLFDRLHDLGPEIDLIFKSQPEFRDAIKNFFELDRPDQISDYTPTEIDLKKILEGLKSDFGYQWPGTLAKVFSQVSVQENVPVFDGHEHAEASIHFILKNFISNALNKRSGSSSLKLRFEQPRGLKSQEGPPTARGILRIEYSISPPLAPDLIEQLGKRSISAAGLTPRRGLYIVGLVTRHLGGTFSAVPGDDGLRTNIILRIPVISQKRSA
jgi:hypothetical protein